MNEITSFEIISTCNTGITFKHENAITFIDFNECAKNYAKDNSLKMSRCVGERDITTYTFTFYTNPKVKLVFKRIPLKERLLGKTKFSKFRDLQNAIIKAGFLTFDLS